MTRWQRPKETFQRGGLSQAGKDFFLQSTQALQHILHHALGAGVQRLDLIGERAVGLGARRAAENTATDVGTDMRIPDKYRREKRATCDRCAENVANPFGKQFVDVFKGGWYAEHLNKVEQRSNRSRSTVREI